MKELPILFSAPMVRAILDGRKTMTRRILTPQPAIDRGALRWKPRKNWDVMVEHINAAMSPYGVPGDRLWVRETFRTWGGTTGFIDYRATTNVPMPDAKWKPSIFMPRWASRITLEVVSVRVERVQNITAPDIEKEGALTELTEIRGVLPIWIRLWDSINAKRGYGWASNPWVWVVEFRKVQA